MRLVKTGPSLCERLERRIAAAHHDVVIGRLRRFREQLEREVELELWTALEAPMVLLLSDVCGALDLTEEERVEVLGQDGEHALADILEVRPVPRFEAPINERQARALAYVREHSTLNLSAYRELCPHWSDETLRLDLANLVARGLLTRNGAKKGTYYVPVS